MCDSTSAISVAKNPVLHSITKHIEVRYHFQRDNVVDEDARWYLSAGRTELRQDVRCNVVVADDVVELETVELVLELADF
jgi:hypothetical protein